MILMIRGRHEISQIQIVLVLEILPDLRAPEDLLLRWLRAGEAEQVLLGVRSGISVPDGSERQVRIRERLNDALERFLVAGRLDLDGPKEGGVRSPDHFPQSGLRYQVFNKNVERLSPCVRHQTRCL